MIYMQIAIHYPKKSYRRTFERWMDILHRLAPQPPQQPQNITNSPKEEEEEEKSSRIF
jgi:hypothetical protein